MPAAFHDCPPADQEVVGSVVLSERSKDELPPLPVPTEGPGAEIVARTSGDLNRMSDDDLLGPDYQAWLARRKTDARTTVTKGFDVRLKADEVMARAEDVLAKLGKRVG